MKRGTKPQFESEPRMRFLVMVKGNKDYEAGAMPSQQELADMGQFNDELVKAGVMLAGEGLQDSSKGVRITYAGNKRTVRDGPFTETKELVAGYWIWQVRSKEEAVEWLKRAPFQEADVEIRPVYEPADFGEALKPEYREIEEQLIAQQVANRPRPS